MNEFLADIKALINTVFTKAFQDWAQINLPAPYVLFNLATVGEGLYDDPNSRLWELTITLQYKDIDDFGTGLMEENLDLLDKALDQECLNGAGYWARLTHEIRAGIPEQDNEYRQRQLIYTVDYTKRS